MHTIRIIINSSFWKFKYYICAMFILGTTLKNVRKVEKF